MVLCYVDDVLEISAIPVKTIEGIKALFKLKGDKAEVPDMYLGASIQKVETADGTECWAEEAMAGNAPPPRESRYMLDAMWTPIMQAICLPGFPLGG